MNGEREKWKLIDIFYSWRYGMYIFQRVYGDVERFFPPHSTSGLFDGPPRSFSCAREHGNFIYYYKYCNFFSFYPFHIIICCILGTMMGLPLNGWLYLNELDLQIVQFSLRFQHVINRPALAHRSGSGWIFSDDHSVGEHTESSSSYFW